MLPFLSFFSSGLRNSSNVSIREIHFVVEVPYGKLNFKLILLSFNCMESNKIIRVTEMYSNFEFTII